jgi:hypothetical protein
VILPAAWRHGFFPPAPTHAPPPSLTPPPRAAADDSGPPLVSPYVDPGLPDLSVASNGVVFSPSPPAPGSLVLVAVQVSNTGPGPSPASKLRAFLGPGVAEPTGCGDTAGLVANSDVPVPALAPGGAAFVNFGIDSMTAGPLWVVVDPDVRGAGGSSSGGGGGRPGGGGAPPTRWPRASANAAGRAQRRASSPPAQPRARPFTSCHAPPPPCPHGVAPVRRA